MNKIDTNIKLTSDEMDLFATLNAVAERNNTTLRAAGGWVRDKLMGVQSDDIDIMVDNMSGEQFAKLVSQHVGSQSPHVIRENPDKSKHIETAKSYIPLPSGKTQEVDFARARKEVYHEGSRIPSIQEATPQEDAMRRDLTINSLFYNLKTRQVEDFTGKGIKDLITNTFRTPDDPIKTFMDDPLRIFRVIRFAAKYNGNIDQATYNAMLNPSLRDAIKNKISKERIGQEFVKMLKNPNPDMAISLLKQTGLLDDIFAESLRGTPYEGAMSALDMNQDNPNHKLSLWEHTFQVVKNTIDMYKEAEPEKRIVMILAALTHDLGKLYQKIQVKKGPNTKYPGHDREYTTYRGHEDESGIIAGLVLKYLKMDPYVQQVSGLAKHHMQPHTLERDESSLNALRKFIRRIGEASLDWIDVFNLATADAYAKDKEISPEIVQRYQGLRKQLDEALQSLQVEGAPSLKPILNGQEIMQALGIKPGPHMKEMTEFIKELRDENPQITKEEAIQRLKEKFSTTKTAQSKVTAACACPKHLLDRKAEVVGTLLEHGHYFQAINEIRKLVEEYSEDESVIRLACVTAYKSILAEPKSRNNDLLQSIFNRVEDNFTDPVLNAYATGILLLIDTPNDEKTILKLGIRSSKLSPGITMNVIDSLPENKKGQSVSRKIYEYLLVQKEKY